MLVARGENEGGRPSELRNSGRGSRAFLGTTHDAGITVLLVLLVLSPLAGLFWHNDC